MPGGLNELVGDVKRAIATYLDPRARSALTQTCKSLHAAVSQKQAKFKELEALSTTLLGQLDKHLATLKEIRIIIDQSELFAPSKAANDEIVQQAADTSDDMMDTAKALSKVVEKLEAGKKLFPPAEQKVIEKLAATVDKRVDAVVAADLAVLALVKKHLARP